MTEETEENQTDENVGKEGESQGTPPPSNAERAKAAEAEKAKVKTEDTEDTEEATEESPEEEQEEKDEPLDTSVWGDTGDEIANSVLQTLQNSGVSTSDAKALLWDAVEAGDPSKVDRDALVEKVGKAKASLIMAGVENVTARNNARVQEVLGIAHEAAGGETNWAKVRDWAQKNVSAEDMNEYREMLDAGGRKAKYAAAQLVQEYNASPNNTALNAGKNQMKGDATKGAPKVEPMTRRQYGDALMKLERRGASAQEFAALKARRNAGIKQGI